MRAHLSSRPQSRQVRHLLAVTMFVVGAAMLPAQVSQYAGDWLLVNGVVVLQIADDGTMTLRGSGEKGKLALNAGQSFTWDVGGKTRSGRFADGKLFLKNDIEGAPKWIEFLEFRRGDKDAAAEAIEFALRQQTQVLNAFANVRRSSTEAAVRNNLRQLSAAADQYFLEHGTRTVKLDDIVGADKYIKKLTPVDGEDYGKLELAMGAAPWKVTTASGIVVSYDRGYATGATASKAIAPAVPRPTVPTNPGDQRRLDAVAAEVAARRLVREQAAGVSQASPEELAKAEGMINAAQERRSRAAFGAPGGGFKIDLKDADMAKVARCWRDVFGYDVKVSERVRDKKVTLTVDEPSLEAVRKKLESELRGAGIELHHRTGEPTLDSATEK
jgi:hypothetical protein